MVIGVYSYPRGQQNLSVSELDSSLGQMPGRLLSANGATYLISLFLPLECPAEGFTETGTLQHFHGLT